MGRSRSWITLGEDLTKTGLTEDDLAKLDAIIALDILPNKTTPHATVLLPASAWVEKRGSMINLKGRLQRLNHAVSAPGDARDDWEILRDLILAISGSNGLYLIEDVFKSLAAEVKEFAGLNLSKIGDLGAQIAQETPPPNRRPPRLRSNPANFTRWTFSLRLIFGYSPAFRC